MPVTSWVGRVGFVTVLATGGAACGMVKTMAIKTVASTLSESGDTLTSHDDPQLIEDAMPFALTLYESLLASVPKHVGLLTTLCSGYTQYAMGFVEPRAEALQWDDFDQSKTISDRALRLAVRGRDYCWRALEERFHGITKTLKDTPEVAARRAKRDDLPLLYWSAASLGAAISTGGLDHPELLVDWRVVRALAERALALDETWSLGAVHELMITVESQGEALGASEARAREHFARAVALQKGLSPAPHVALAMGVVKAKRDRAEFQELLDQALAIDANQNPNQRLVVLITQARARVLLAHIDEMFLKLPARPWPAQED